MFCAPRRGKRNRPMIAGQYALGRRRAQPDSRDPPASTRLWRRGRAGRLGIQVIERDFDDRRIARAGVARAEEQAVYFRQGGIEKRRSARRSVCVDTHPVQQERSKVFARGRHVFRGHLAVAVAVERDAAQLFCAREGQPCIHVAVGVDLEVGDAQAGRVPTRRTWQKE